MVRKMQSQNIVSFSSKKNYEISKMFISIFPLWILFLLFLNLPYHFLCMAHLLLSYSLDRDNISADSDISL